MSSVIATAAGATHMSAARSRLATVLRAANGVISIQTVVDALGVDRTAAAKLLSRWRQQGWLRRVASGMYVPVPLVLANSEQVIGDPWVLVPELFGKCYIGGWTAAQHWDLTEQLFNETIVFTARRVVRRRHVAQGVAFIVQHVTAARMFGIKPVWRGPVRVPVSDPARTLVDMLAAPGIGGGIDHVADCLAALHRTQSFDAALLMRYAERFGNGAIFKRLGYLADSRLHDAELAAACRERLTSGYARLDPALACERLVTAWRVRVPQRVHSADA